MSAHNGPRLFGLRDVVLLLVAWVVVFGAINAAVRAGCAMFGPFNCAVAFPVSLVSWRLPTDSVGAAVRALVPLTVAAIGVGGVCVIVGVVVARSRVVWRSAWLLALLGVALVLATNLLQGTERGFEDAVTGQEGASPHQWVDAARVTNPWEFVRTFEERQLRLTLHSRTHPPGSVLLFVMLGKLVGSPGRQALTLAIVSSLASAMFVSGILRRTLGDDAIARYAALLFLVVPAVQIYYAASADALIASFLTGALYFFLHPRTDVAVAGAVLLILAASFLTFAFVFVLPVLAGFELVKTRRAWRSSMIVAAVCGTYILLAIWGFDYWAAFRAVARIENPQGFWMLVDPRSYVVTRFEDVLEIVFFLGPFLFVLAYRGWRGPRAGDLQLLTWLAVGTLVTMFLTGAYKTGETARSCIFIVPYLVFPIASALKERRPSPFDLGLLPGLVLVQVIGMQIFGYYLW